MTENEVVDPIVQSLTQKKHESCRDFDQKQREYYARAQELAKEILERKRK
jgi:hypothetical protein